MATNLRLIAYFSVFVALWALVSTESTVLFVLVVPSVTWAIARAVVVRGKRALAEDVPARFGELRSDCREMLFLVAVPAVLTAAQFAGPSQREGILISLSFFFAATHMPQAIAAVATTPSARSALGHAVVVFACGLIFAAIVSLVDVQLAVWASALLAPTDSSCSRPKHPLAAAVASVVTSHQHKLEGARTIAGPVIDQMGRLGEVPYVYTSLVLMYVFGAVATVSPRARRYLQVPLAAVIYGGIISAGLKIFIHRERPMVRGDPFVFTGPSVGWKSTKEFSKLDLSFPSGHVVVTMAVARCLVRLWILDFCDGGDAKSKISWCSQLARGIPFYAMAALVGVSRFCRCRHWASDCAAGAVLGIFVADVLVVAPLERNYARPADPPSPTVVTTPLPDQYDTHGRQGAQRGSAFASAAIGSPAARIGACVGSALQRLKDAAQCRCIAPCLEALATRGLRVFKLVARRRAAESRK